MSVLSEWKEILSEMETWLDEWIHDISLQKERAAKDILTSIGP